MKSDCWKNGNGFNIQNAQEVANAARKQEILMRKYNYGRHMFYLLQRLFL